jgi:ribose transport system permease protein
MKGKNLIGIIIAWVVIYAIFAFLKPATFMSLSNIELMMRQSIVVGLGAIGMTYVIMTGGIDLSAGSVVAFSAVTTAIVQKQTSNPILALVSGIGVGILAGLVNGTIVAKLKVGPFITTLVSMLIIRGLAKGLSNERSVNSVPDSWLRELVSSLGDGEKWRLMTHGAWIWIILLVIMHFVLYRTVFGRNVVATGSNEKTAILCGIKTDRVKIAVYTLCGFFAGLAGLMSFSRSTVGDPSGSQGEELKMIAAAVIGGASLSGGEGSLIGALFGTLIMTTINMGCVQMQIPNWVQEILTGLIILIAVGVDKWRLAKAAKA